MSQWIHVANFGRVRTPVFVHWSAFLVSAALGTLSLKSPIYAALAIVCYFTVIAIHELGHAWVARRLGYDVLAIRIGLIHGQCVTLVASAAIGLVLLASLLLVRQRRAVDERPAGVRPAAAAVVAAGDTATAIGAAAERSGSGPEPGAIGLRNASQTFRHSTLLFAVRRAGFYCADVVSAHESADGVWVASCSDMLGYIVTLRGAEQFDVQPVAQYFDSVAPAPVDRDRLPGPRPLEPRSLEPRTPSRW